MVVGAAAASERQSVMQQNRLVPTALLGLVVALSTSCAHERSEAHAVADVSSRDYSPAAALRDAAADLAVGCPKVYIAGTFAVGEIGINNSNRAVVASLPRWYLPFGCTTPHASEAATYAETYNRAVADELGRRAKF